jgi:hypothetical protein
MGRMSDISIEELKTAIMEAYLGELSVELTDDGQGLVVRVIKQAPSGSNGGGDGGGSGK